MMQPSLIHPTRATVTIHGRQLSYLDFGGTGPVLLALHGHFGEATTFTSLAGALVPEWRVIALDQRGHGHSDRAGDYTREGYVQDAVAVTEQLNIAPVTVLGHSLGGVNAYQLAARNPQLVNAMVIEDIGAEVAGDLSFSLVWPHRAPTRAALVQQLGGSAKYLTGAFREHPDGWGLAFHPEDMVASQEQLNGNHWDDWLATTCPTLLVRGAMSSVLSAEHARHMATRRPQTQLVELPTGHSVHETDPDGFSAAVRSFLRDLASNG